MLQQLLTRVSLVWQDASATRATSSLNSNETQASVLNGALASLRAVWEPTSDAAVIGANIRWSAEEQSTVEAFGPTPLLYTCTFVFSDALAENYLTIIIPSFNPSFILPDGLIDLTNPSITAFIDGVIANCCNPFGVLMTELAAAFYSEAEW